MKLKNLIEKLEAIQEKHPEIEVFLSSDEEGNSFRGLGDIQLASYNDSGREIDIGVFELTNELRKLGYGEEDLFEKKCLVLW